jgi:hypothetical protein
MKPLSNFTAQQAPVAARCMASTELANSAVVAALPFVCCTVRTALACLAQTEYSPCMNACI